MFKKRYIFETRTTRTKRYLRNFAIVGMSGVFVYCLVCVLFLMASENENRESAEALFKRPPDIIVVFTGDKGRIPRAIELAKQYGQNNILISGVHLKNNVTRIVQSLDLASDIDPSFLKIDQRAKNTVENVIETLNHLRNSKGIERVLIVSHDYHITRIKIIVQQFKRKSDPFHFFYTGVKTDYSKFDNVKKLFIEVFKFLRAYIFIQMWDPNV